MSHVTRHKNEKRNGKQKNNKKNKNNKNNKKNNLGKKNKNYNNNNNNKNSNKNKNANTIQPKRMQQLSIRLQTMATIHPLMEILGKQIDMIINVLNMVPTIINLTTIITKSKKRSKILILAMYPIMTTTAIMAIQMVTTIIIITIVMEIKVPKKNVKKDKEKQRKKQRKRQRKTTWVKLVH